MSFYSQYSRPSNLNGNTSVVTQQQGMQWNGVSWVPQATPVGAGTYSTSQFSSSNRASAPVPASIDAASQYTQYYHKWKANASEHRERARILPDGKEKEEALRQAQWADYYAEQSSRMFHHHSATNGSGPTTQAPQIPTAPSSHSLSSPAPLSQHTPNKKVQAPQGMMGYVNRCLSQCRTDEEKQLMRKAVEKVIRNITQRGSMSTMEWDKLTIVTLESISNTNVVISKKPVSLNLSQAPSSTKKNSQKIRNQNLLQEEDHGYYGPCGTEKGKETSSLSSHTPKRKHSLGESSPVSSSNDSEFGGDFISLSPSQKKKAKKHKNGANLTDGFQRSSSALQKRASRFSGKGGLADASRSSTGAGDMKRFMGMALIGGKPKKLDEVDYEHMTVKGTCQTLEKDYLRLTAPPRAEAVRPQRILELHLKNLKKAWMQPKHKEYSWFCSQFKAIRQDLTVQRIFNAVSVDVYETHARIALEQGDINEYNQCQTQLKELYENLDRSDEVGLKNQNEFIAYRLIYYVFLTGNKKYEGGSSDLFKIMLSLTPEQREDPCIEHALKVRVAVGEYDYHAFFRLLDSCPLMGAYLMDLMVPGVRHTALLRICKAFRPSVPVSFVMQELGFDDKEQGKKWLLSCGCVLEGVNLLTKESVVRESDLKEKISSLI